MLRSLLKLLQGKSGSLILRTIRCKDVVHRQRQPWGEWLCRVLQRQATRRTLESRVVLELGGGLLGDRPLATGLQPLPHPHCIELSDPRRVCGWLCSSSFGYASASRTQPLYQPQFSPSTWCKDWGVVPTFLRLTRIQRKCLVSCCCEFRLSSELILDSV